MVTVEQAAEGAAPAGVAPAGVGWPWRAAWPAAAVALAFSPLLALHARMLWARPHYQFFPLVIPGAAALAWKSCQRLGPLQPGDRKAATGLAALGWALLAFGVVFVSPGAGAVGALVTLLAALYALGGRVLVRAALPAWAFLWLAVPLPRRYDTMLITGLQSLVSGWASQFLDAFDVHHIMEGNVVEIAGGRLLVDEACSGINSLLTLLLGALFFALWTGLSVVRPAVLAAAAVFWVVFGNVLRVVTIVVVNAQFHKDLSHGWKHTALGVLLFVAMLGMVAATDQLYAFAASVVRRARWWATGAMNKRSPKAAGRRAGAGSGVGHSAGPAAADRAGAAPTWLADPRRTWLGTAWTAAAFGALLLPQCLMPGVDWKEVLVSHDVYSGPFAKLGEGSMSARSGPFERVGFTTQHREMNDSWGENSRLWVYRMGTRGVFASVDYQFVDWHDLTLCYRGQGWQLTGRSTEPSDMGGAVETADFINPQGWYGYLVFGLYGRDGRSVPPPESVGYLSGLGDRLLGWFRGSSKTRQAVARLNHQVQVFVESESPLSPGDREQVRAFYDQARGVVRRDGLGIGEASR
jgi:exosortase